MTATTNTAPPAGAAGPDVIPPRVSTGHAPGTEGTVAGRTLRYGLLILFVIVIIIPLYVLFVTSFKRSADVNASQAWTFPSAWSVGGWRAAWDALSPALFRSVILATSVAVLSAALGSLNGFVFAKWRFPGATTIFTLFLFGMFIPYQAVMIPLQGMLLDVQATPGFSWFDGIAKLVAVHVIFGIPICTLIFRNYYATAVPNEMLEAAKVDGAGMLRTFRSIVLPLSAPGFVVTMIWQFTSAWNDFLFALFLTNRNTGPVTYALNELAGGQNPDYPSIMAGVLLASLPTLLVYILLGRYFIGGLMSGSVK
ncbi:carbohydrate ABC transporter permease [Intrasporangium calvum]|uniref:Carbohydrate ABC transporter permease n=1 Tax=Intrasporangium calvum TaxID=53358 RepID=A0ABT5GEM4_9MICO|nr:carbohydrate ABC transporter permease [Intrasporangium calvum]MDC5696326.1 carbohydrate ABC transporter permease [Intrasporangium calvum]